MKVTPDGHVIDSDLPELSEDGRRAAQDRSGSCKHCCGNGLTLVHAVDPDMRAQVVAATCVCIHGRWIRAWHTQHGRSILERIPDLVAVLNGRDSRWRLL